MSLWFSITTWKEGENVSNYKRGIQLMNRPNSLIVFSMICVTLCITTISTLPVTAADEIIDETTTVPAGYYWWYCIETNYDNLKMILKIEVVSGNDINVYVFDSENFDKWENNETVLTYCSRELIGSFTVNITLETKGTYYIVLDNAYSIVTGKSVHVNVVLEELSRDDSSSLFLLGFTVFIILISLGGLIALYFYRRSSQTARSSNNWPSVVGEIVSSFIGEQQTRDHVFHEPIITYSYNVGGRDYQAKRVVIGQWAHAGNLAWTEQKVQKYRPGKSVTVYYNPNSPEMAVLEPGMNPQIRSKWIGVSVCGCCFGVPVVLFISFILAGLILIYIMPLF